MIVVRLFGGLGNQMFQYAFARGLSEYWGQEIAFDLSFYSKTCRRFPRELGLTMFGLDIPSASRGLIFNVQGRSFCDRFLSMSKLGSRLSEKVFKNRKIVSEQQIFSYQDISLEAAKDIYLTGYWQHQRYFQAIEDEVLKLFVFPYDPIAPNVRPGLSAPITASIHVRLGDYLGSAHDVCSDNYYEMAMNLLERDHGVEKFLVFSDDIRLASTKSLFKRPDVKFVSSSLPIDDMARMSACNHNILVNSTFSWWAARLNKNPNKVNIFPDLWTRDSKLPEGLITDSAHVLECC